MHFVPSCDDLHYLNIHDAVIFFNHLYQDECQPPPTGMFCYFTVVIANDCQKFTETFQTEYKYIFLDQVIKRLGLFLPIPQNSSMNDKQNAQNKTHG